MDGNRQVEVHYIDAGFPYTVPQSLMDLFEGLSVSYALADVALSQDQGNSHWPMMQTNSPKYGFSGSGSNPYYSFNNSYEINDYVPRLVGERRMWDNPSPPNNLELPQVVVREVEDAVASTNLSTEDCDQANHSLSSPQHIIWQDRLDPDNMTYEELLDLGEAVGNQSRGLSQDKISLLPVTKYKCSFFPKKKSQRERCVICQMDYKRGDWQMTLPCKHGYHSGCISRWLGINKACPVCSAEVFGEQPSKK